MLGDNFSIQILVGYITLGWQLANSPPPAMSVFQQHRRGVTEWGWDRKNDMGGFFSFSPFKIPV